MIFCTATKKKFPFNIYLRPICYLVDLESVPHQKIRKYYILSMSIIKKEYKSN